MTLLPLTVAVPLLMAALLAGLSKVIPRMLADVLAIATAAALATFAGMLAWQSSQFGTLVYWFGNWHPRPGGIAIGIAFVADPLGAGLAAFVGLLGTAALVFSWRYFESVGALFHALMLVFLGAMAGFCLSGDLFTMFVFFELMGTAAFALTGHKIEAESLEGALNFAIINSLGAFLTLWGIGLLYGRFGALNLAQLGRAMEAAGPPDVLVIVAFALIACGFLVKAAMVPFHFWLADAHAVAPTPACVLFSGVMVELGLYGVARVYCTVFAASVGPHMTGLRLVLLSLGAVTALVGALMCHRQRHLKRLLAFSTISHAGIMLGSIATRDATEMAGVALYVFSHGAVKGALFLCTGILLHRLGSVDQLALRGRGRIMPWTGAMFVSGRAGAGWPAALWHLPWQGLDGRGASHAQPRLGSLGLHAGCRSDRRGRAACGGMGFRWLGTNVLRGGKRAYQSGTPGIPLQEPAYTDSDGRRRRFLVTSFPRGGLDGRTGALDPWSVGTVSGFPGLSCCGARCLPDRSCVNHDRSGRCDDQDFGIWFRHGAGGRCFCGLGVV